MHGRRSHLISELINLPVHICVTGGPVNFALQTFKFETFSHLHAHGTICALVMQLAARMCHMLMPHLTPLAVTETVGVGRWDPAEEWSLSVI